MNEGADRLADARRRNPLTRRDDLARDLETKNVARAGRRRIIARPLQHVRPVHPCRRYLYQDLSGTRTRHRHAGGA